MNNIFLRKLARAQTLLSQRLTKLLILGILVLTTTIASPAVAQLNISEIFGDSQEQNVTNWLRLDGYPIVEISAPSTALSKRMERIEKNLEKIRSDYLQQKTMNVEITAVKQTDNNLPEIYVNGYYLMTITEADAQSQGITPWDVVRILKKNLPEILKKAKIKQQSEPLVRQIAIAAGILLGTSSLSWIIWRLQKNSRFEKVMGKILFFASHQNISEEQTESVHKAKKVLFPAVQAYLWMGSMLAILHTIPYTRSFREVLLSFLQIPLIVVAIVVVMYVINQLIYVLIDRFVGTLVGHNALERVMGEPRRQEQRIVSISLIGKSMTRLIIIIIGIFLALTTTGINLVSLLAVAGLIGLIVTFTAQSFLKDAINGIFILLEDQFALDDVIVIENLKLGGLVENMTLRITQLRDAEGRLISVPNSKIETVSNFTHHWARVDLKIPVPYNGDINKALAIVKKVAEEMKEDEQWQDIFLDEPELLGVDEFAEWRALIRLWIKVKPIRQWDVSRECRRRIMLAFQEANLDIPVMQHDIRIKTSLSFESETEEQPSKIEKNGQL